MSKMIRKVALLQRYSSKHLLPQPPFNTRMCSTVSTNNATIINTLTNKYEHSSMTTNKIQLLHVVNFSSMPSPSMMDDKEDDQVVIIPPNLKFDRRATSTPIYGLEEVNSTHDNDDDLIEEDHDGEENVATTTQNTEDSIEDDEDDDYDDDYDDDDDYEEEIGSTTYSLADKPEPLYVTPLPQRLHVHIKDILDTTEVGTIHLSPYLFGQDPIRTDILHRCVVYQRNKKRGRRNNGARTKTVSTKSGSGKKMRNQKGGGVARAGHKRAAHWRGGAKAHGPKGNDQNYETKLNKKVRMMGIRMALSQKLKEGNLIVVNGFDGLESYKTKTLAKYLEDIGDIGGRFGCTAYIVDHVPEEEEENDDGTLKGLNGVHINLQVASGNISKVKVRNQKFVNVYDLLKYEKLVMSLSALEALEERYAEK